MEGASRLILKYVILSGGRLGYQTPLEKIEIAADV
jgi:hypothetical protein